MSEDLLVWVKIFLCELKSVFVREDLYLGVKMCPCVSEGVP